MQYNFDEEIPRKGHSSQKWEAAKEDDILPMWVADMDFRAAQPILDALEARWQHGIFGYAHAPNRFYEATIHWFEKRHNFTIQKEWLLYTIGVIPALSAIIKALTSPSDKVLVQTPVYNGFFPPIANNRVEPAKAPLSYQDGRYTIDFDILEQQAKDPKVKLMLLCNPHNPAGRVWTKDELQRIGDICIANNVLVVSDEIHCDLVFNEHQHIPFASISDDFLLHSITCLSPSKTFNLAGLQIANIFVADKNIREKINQALRQNTVHEISPFAIEALVAAYTKGEEWLDQLKPYLYNNYLYLNGFIEQHLPKLKVLPLEATYLVWVDCKALNISSEEISKKLYNEGKLWINSGPMYGGDAGEGFIRINIACPRSLLVEGLNRLKIVLEQL